MTRDPGRPYEGYDILDKWRSPSFDEQTRAVWKDRVTRPPQRRFFEQWEWDLVEAIAARVVPQPERGDDPLPIAPFIDDKLAADRRDGYRKEHMPPQREAWRVGLGGIQDECALRHGRRFEALGDDEKDDVLRALMRGEGRSEAWRRVPQKEFITATVVKNIVHYYWSYPQPLSEIGYGGPASPRGYVRLGANERDAWEAPLATRGRRG